jgi:hypothetical protein
VTYKRDSIRGKRVGNLYRNDDTRIMRLVCQSCGLEQDVDTRDHRWPYDMPAIEAIGTLPCVECHAKTLIER